AIFQSIAKRRSGGGLGAAARSGAALAASRSPGRAAALSGNDDFEPLSGSGLIGNGIAVHDCERGWLCQTAPLALGNQLPRIAGARSVEVDAIRPNAFGFGPRQRAKGSQRLPECGIHAIEEAYRRHAGSQVNAA